MREVIAHIDLNDACYRVVQTADEDAIVESRVHESCPWIVVDNDAECARIYMIALIRENKKYSIR